MFTNVFTNVMELKFSSQCFLEKKRFRVNIVVVYDILGGRGVKESGAAAMHLLVRVMNSTEIAEHWGRNGSVSF